MSLVRSKNPMFFFQLMPHLQCCKPMNCCFIFLPQTGQTLLLAPMPPPPSHVPIIPYPGGAFTCKCGPGLHTAIPKKLKSLLEGFIDQP